jgi:NAD(P)H-hydrate epimerase
MERLHKDKVTSKEVGILDYNSEWLGIPKSHLMECAGYSFAMEIIEKYNLGKDSKALIFCGTGNNGGDGFVIARHLSSMGIKVKLILMGTPNKINTEEAQLNWKIISENLTDNISIKIIKDSTDVVALGILLDNEEFDILIDGMLGTGIKGKIREPIATAIDFINEIKDHQEKIRIISIDVPSGLDPDTGQVPDKAVKADLVITFHRNKKGMEVSNPYIKEIVVKSIGIPQEAQVYVGKGDLIPTLKKRESDFHKGQFGRMLVIGGSKNYSGAPAYTSLAGINFGLDLVITYTPQIIGDVLRSYSQNMIVRTSPGDWLTQDAYEEICSLVDWSNAIVVGPGLGKEKETENLLVELLKYFKKNNKSFVLDADALKLIKTHFDLIKGQSCILTPHEGEFKIMSGIELPSYKEKLKRKEKIHQLAQKLDVTLLVKGPYDYICDSNDFKINKTGCPEMAVGGTGDILAGLCACFLTTENSPFESACSAAFLNGYLGEYTKKHYGSRFTSMDMIKNLNEVLKEF